MGFRETYGCCAPLKCFLKGFQRYTVVQLLFMMTFLMSGLVMNTVGTVMYVVLRQLNKPLYRRLYYYISLSFFGHLMFLTQWWSESTVNIYVEDNEMLKHFGKEHSLDILNHSYEVDWLATWHFLDGLRILGNFKPVLKKSLQWIPSIGLIIKFSEFILLNRSFEKDKDIIREQIDSLGDYKDPVSVLLYPEGTRLTEAKLKAAQDFAKERGLPLLKYHLLPRTKGFTSTLESLNDKIKVIYNWEVAFKQNDEYPPTMLTFLRGKPITAHLYVERIEIKDLPADNDGRIKWLYDLYEKKDRLLTTFHETGSFVTNSNKPIKPFIYPRRMWSVFNFIIWAIVIYVPLINLSIVSVLNGEYLHVSIIMGVFLLFYIFMKFALRATEIKKSSSYGITKKAK